MDCPLDGELLSFNTIKTCMAAITELHQYQLSQVTSTDTILRGTFFRAKMKAAEHSKFSMQRLSFRNRGIHGLTNGYTEKELLACQVHLLTENFDNRTASQHLRTRLDIFLGHFSITRGEIAESETW